MSDHPPIKTAIPRKKRIISYRVNDAEFLRLAQRAAASDMPVNQLARHLALTKIEDIVIEARQSHDPALLKQLYHIGHNLNQLVKNAHIFGRISPRVEQLCERIDKLMDESLSEEQR